MTSTACFRIISDCSQIVGNAVALSWFQLSIVPERHQLFMGDMLNAFEIIRKFIPQLIEFIP